MNTADTRRPENWPISSTTRRLTYAGYFGSATSLDFTIWQDPVAERDGIPADSDDALVWYSPVLLDVGAGPAPPRPLPRVDTWAELRHR